MKIDLSKFIGSKIRFYRKRLNLTQEELGNKLNTSKSRISNYETGYRTPQQDDLFRLAKILNISIDDLFPTSNSNNITAIYNQLTEYRKTNVLDYAEDQLNQQQNENVIYPTFSDVDVSGILTAGYGTTNFDKNHPIDTYTINTEDVPDNYDYAFLIKGDSMYPTFNDGDIVYISKTDDIQNSMIGAVEINGEAFLKKIYKRENGLELLSLNDDKDLEGNLLYPPIEITSDDEISVIGKVVF